MIKGFEVRFFYFNLIKQFELFLYFEMFNSPNSSV